MVDRITVREKRLWSRFKGCPFRDIFWNEYTGKWYPNAEKTFGLIYVNSQWEKKNKYANDRRKIRIKKLLSDFLLHFKFVKYLCRIYKESITNVYKKKNPALDSINYFDTKIFSILRYKKRKRRSGAIERECKWPFSWHVRDST